MAARSNALVAALVNVVNMHPRLSAGLAFELGVMVGSFIKNARGRQGLAGATAKLIDTVPLLSSAAPERRTRSKAPARRPKAKRKAA